MNKYPTLTNLLTSIYSVDVGLDEPDEKAALQRALDSNNQRVAIENELKDLFSDPNAPWMDLVENDDYVAYPADDNEDAKKYIIDKLWVNVFPGENYSSK